MKTLIFTVCSFSFCLLITSCSNYNKVVKNDNYQEKFELANELFEKKEYLKSITLFEQVYQRIPKTGEGELSYYRIARAYYEKSDYPMAGYYFSSFVQRYPYSNKAQESLFLTAMCSVQNSPDFSLDQNDTKVAIDNLQQFIDRYPESSLVDSCNHVMDRLLFKLEKKDFEAVKLYSKTQNYRAAAASSKSFIEDYPRSRFREEVYYMLVSNLSLLTVNSVENKKCERIEQTIESYRNFVAEFPETVYKVEINKISDKMHKEFEEFCTKEKK
jgi:outer membrane protein assembly factor BamD